MQNRCASSHCFPRAPAWFVSRCRASRMKRRQTALRDRGSALPRCACGDGALAYASGTDVAPRQTTRSILWRSGCARTYFWCADRRQRRMSGLGCSSAYVAPCRFPARRDGCRCHEHRLKLLRQDRERSRDPVLPGDRLRPFTGEDIRGVHPGQSRITRVSYVRAGADAGPDRQNWGR